MESSVLCGPEMEQSGTILKRVVVCIANEGLPSLSKLWLLEDVYPPLYRYCSAIVRRSILGRIKVLKSPLILILHRTYYYRIHCSTIYSTKFLQASNSSIMADNHILGALEPKTFDHLPDTENSDDLYKYWIQTVENVTANIKFTDHATEQKYKIRYFGEPCLAKSL